LITKHSLSETFFFLNNSIILKSMPKTEKELVKYIRQANTNRSHHRPLEGIYSYNHILHTNLFTECINLYQQKKRKIKVLDIGCGDGFAMSQLKEKIAKEGLEKHFEFYGMGINKYRKMYLKDQFFIKQTFMNYQPVRKKFDLIISVYTFQYILRKLEAIELIHNNLLALNGKAIIHFPGYLISFSEKSEVIDSSEDAGNRLFMDFINNYNLKQQTELNYCLIPHYSDEENGEIFTEFGNLKFLKNDNSTLSFMAELEGFSIFDRGFTHDSMDQKLTYVRSFYKLNDPQMLEKQYPLSQYQDQINTWPGICRLDTITGTFNDKNYHLHLAVHPKRSKVIVGIYPAAREELTGTIIPYQEMTSVILNENIGAVVRSNGPYGSDVEFHQFNDLFVHIFIDYIQENAKKICGYEDPDKKMLLLAPSYDSDKEKLKKNLNRYRGELYILVGDRDEVVLPEQVYWFFKEAKKAKVCKYVELISCEHPFIGEKNHQKLLKAPLWAFKGAEYD